MSGTSGEWKQLQREYMAVVMRSSQCPWDYQRWYPGQFKQLTEWPLCVYFMAQSLLSIDLPYHFRYSHTFQLLFCGGFVRGI